MLPSPHPLLVDVGNGLSDGLQGWQVWWQTGAVLLCITAAVAWLTARWLNRRRSGCAGDCSRCVAHGAEARPGPCARTQEGPGVRSASLRVLPGAANLPHSGDV
jgi:hypothetical protein